MSQEHLNPLGLLVRSGGHDEFLSHASIATVRKQVDSIPFTNIIKNSSTEHYHDRVRRELNDVFGAESYVRNNKKPLRIIKMVRRTRNYYSSMCSAVYILFLWF